MIHPVIIVGAGPVGMIAAMDLAYRGVPSIILEMRTDEAPALARCNTTSARTMETLRRLGCDQAYRQCGLPAGFTNDVTWSTAIAGREFARFHLPAAGTTAGEERLAHDSRWPSSERPHRASQFYLERVLRSHTQTFDAIDLRFCQEVVGISQHDDVVDIQVKDTRTGRQENFTTRFLLGSDGGRSAVRKQSGIKLLGDTAPVRVQTILIRSRDVLPKMKENNGVGWMNAVENTEGGGSIIAIDGDELWLMHTGMLPDEKEVTPVSIERQIRAIMGCKIEYEVVDTYIWQPNRLVAETYRDGNVFLAGDAAHVWPPMAGHGMNTGIEDGVGFSWLIAGIINGWAPVSILDAYDAERHRAGEQVSRTAQGLAFQRSEIMRTVENLDVLNDAGEEGVRARKAVHDQLVMKDSTQFSPQGMNFGLCYDRSPLIIYDEGVAPEYEVRKYTPSTVPGCRAPFFALIEDGTSIYDHMSQGYTLLRSDESLDVSGFVEAAESCGMPFKVIDIQFEPSAQEVYDHALVLVRPDDRVAWRGNALPDDPQQIIDTVRGVS